MRAFAPCLLIGLVFWAASVPVLPLQATVERSPNELGSIMILEYHRIAEPDGRVDAVPRPPSRRSRAALGRRYRSIALNALITGSIDLPSGTSPVVLTFDDSSPGQFRYLERDGRLEIDPDCAVGILEAFTRLHPRFGLNATFFVLPAAAEPNRLFGQPEHELHKLQYLVSRGFELGNHTLWHADLAKYPEAVVRAQLARAQARATSRCLVGGVAAGLIIDQENRREVRCAFGNHGAQVWDV